ncbi:MAG: type II secretion system F family protein [Proteobacteria bacterium]|nr:type II secretion system F family protein [Pseudomonadota bacterium]
MPVYQYDGRDKAGRRQNGRVEARNEAEARQLIKFMGLPADSLKGTGGISLEIKLPPAVQKFFDNRRGVSDKDLVTFTKQLSVMIDAGVSVIKALEILQEQAENPIMRRALEEVRSKVERGQELGDAMEKVPAVFDSLYCSLVRAGSTSGQLDVILKRLSNYIEKSAKLKRQLYGALFYPAIIIALAVGLTAFMLLVVVPMLAQTFIDGGKELPGLTMAVIGASEFLRENFLYIVAAMIAGGFFFKRWIQTPAGRYQWDALLLRIPLIGTLVKKISIARFASTTATLVASGIGITDVLQTSSAVLGNKVLEKGILRIREAVIQGKGMGGPMSEEAFIPQMVSSMVSIGEASGRLDTMLQKVSDFYEEEVDVAMAAVLKAIEPLLFVVIGGIVGVILIAMYLPVFDLASVG